MDKAEILKKYRAFCEEQEMGTYYPLMNEDMPWHTCARETVRGLYRPGDRILEYGCGMGQWGLLLYCQGITDYIGADTNGKAVAKGIEFAQSVGIRLDLRVNDVMRDKLGNFDFVAPLNFSYEPQIDIDRLVINCRDNLKPAGYLVLDIMEPDEKLYNPNSLSGGMPLWKRYVHKYSEVMMKDIFYRYGFEFISKTRTWDFPRAIYLGRKAE